MTTMRPMGGDDRPVSGQPRHTRRFDVRDSAQYGGFPERATVPRARHRYVEPTPHRERFGWPGRAIRGITGLLAGGWCVLAVVLLGLQVRAGIIGEAGPGVIAVVMHLVIAVLALIGQSIADRRSDTRGTLATAGVFVLVFGALWYWWWA